MVLVVLTYSPTAASQLGVMMDMVNHWGGECMKKKLRGKIIALLAGLLVTVNALATDFFEVSLSIDLECSTCVMIID